MSRIIRLAVITVLFIAALITLSKIAVKAEQPETAPETRIFREEKQTEEKEPEETGNAAKEEAQTAAAQILTREREETPDEIEAVRIQNEPREPLFCARDDIPLSAELQEYTKSVCERYGVDINLAYAIMSVESGYNPDAQSPTNDYGIMQINAICESFLYNNLGTTDLLDARQNIKAGIFLLSLALDKYGDEAKALMAYNLGDGGAAAEWEKGIYNNYYSNKVQEEKRRIINESGYIYDGE